MAGSFSKWPPFFQQRAAFCWVPKCSISGGLVSRLHVIIPVTLVGQKTSWKFKGRMESCKDMIKIKVDTGRRLEAILVHI